MVFSCLRRHGPAFRVRMLLCLLVAAMLARALVPTGFMPDTQALRHGKVEITFCSAAGVIANLAVALDADRSHGPQPEQLATDCAFGVIGQQAIANATALPAIRVLRMAISRAPYFTSAGLPAMPAAGPPLGSRAPPLPLA